MAIRFRALSAPQRPSAESMGAEPNEPSPGVQRIRDHRQFLKMVGAALGLAGAGQLLVGTRPAGATITPSGTSDSESNNLYVTGNLGVGTTAPAAKLDVTGGYLRALDNGTNVPPAAGRGVEMVGLGGVGYLISFNRDLGAYQPLQIDASPVAFLGGMVAVGTTSPAANLHMFGTGPAVGSTLFRVEGQYRQHGLYVDRNGAGGRHPLHCAGQR